MSLFNKKSLESLNSPEQLDQPMQLIRPRYWTLLISLLCFSVAVILWSIFGRIPVRLSGLGVLVYAESLQTVQAEVAGRVLEFRADVGQCVSKGTSLVRLESLENELDLEKARIKLRLLINQDKTENKLAAQRVQELQEQVNRVQGLTITGAISADDLSQRNQQLSSTRLELESKQNIRQQEIQDQRSLIKNLDQSIQQTSIVRAPSSGCIVDRLVKQGQFVQAGASLFELEHRSRKDKLQSLVFFRPGDGKRLKVGQSVQITPESTNLQRHGGIEGEILRIQALPVNDEAIIARLGNPSWIKQITGGETGPLMQVTTSLSVDPATFSGYDWGGGPGPDLKLSAGTPTSVRVLVEERRPISYIIPILRDLSGIY